MVFIVQAMLQVSIQAVLCEVHAINKQQTQHVKFPHVIQTYVTCIYI